MSYASASDVAMYTPNLLDGSDNFTSTTRPTITAVNRFLSAGCSLIHARLEAAGYATPITGTAAIYDQLVDLEAIYAAGRAEMVRLTSRVAVTERTRSQYFMGEFNKGLDTLMKLDLSRLGVGADASKMYAGGLSESDVQSVEDDTDRVVPRFKRGQFRHPGTTRPESAGDDELTD